MTESMITLDVWAIAQAMSGTTKYGFRSRVTGPADARRPAPSPSIAAPHHRAGRRGDAPKDAIDELARVRTAEGLRQLDRFVDGRLERDAGQVANLETRDSQQGALHLRHLVETPVTRSLRQVGIDLGLMVADSLDQGAGELRHFGISARLGDMILKRSFRIAAVGLQLEQHFEGELAGRVAPSHLL